MRASLFTSGRTTKASPVDDARRVSRDERMIDQIDERLKTWVASIVGDVPVAFTPPREAQAEPVVHLYLMKIVPVLANPDPNRLPRQVKLCYLIVVRAADPAAAHKL